MNQLAKFAGLSSSDKLLLLRTWTFLALATARLRLLPHSFNRRWIERSPSSGPQAPESAAERLAWAIRISSQFVPTGNCLPQALAARTLLSSMGYSSTLRLGVHKQAEEFRAHAWLESNGRIWIGAESEYEAGLGPSWAPLE